MPALHVQHRTGPGWVPEGPHLALHVVPGPHDSQLLELGARHVAALPLRPARQLLAPQGALDHALEQPEQPLLAAHVQRQRRLGGGVDREALHLHQVARVDALVHEVAGDPPLLTALEEGHVVAADAAEVRERRRVEVHGADPPERDERLADAVPEEEGHDKVHLAERAALGGRVEVVLAHERQPEPLGHQVHPLLVGGPVVRVRGHHGDHLAAALHEPRERPCRGALALGHEHDSHATSSS